MRLFLLIFVCISTAACVSKSSSNTKNNSAVDTSIAANMQFESSKIDFGTVEEGEKVILQYTFKNVGGKNLVIYEAIPSCGCTMPKFDPSPVKPGEKRTVEVTFDSDTWSGIQQKSVTFKTNGVPNYTTIVLTGNVN